MKKLTFILTIFLLISTISAIEIESQDIFKQGETFIATIQGNILEPIEKQDMGFFQGHIERPLDFDFNLIDGKYYIYTILPYSEETYTLKIQDVYFKENNKYQTQTFEKTFSISNELADFNVEPGIVRAKENFTLDFYNNLNQNLEITANTTNFTKTFLIPLQDSKKIFFDISDIPNGLTTIDLSSADYTYSLPIKIENKNITEEPEENETEEIINTEKFQFSISELPINLSSDKKFSYYLALENIGNTTIEEISLSFTDDLNNYIQISPNPMENLEKNTSYELNLTIELPEGDYKGFLVAESENYTDSVKLLFYSESNIPVITPESGKKTCKELGYKKCSVCYGNTFQASDGLCCIGSCEQIIEKPERNWVAIIMIVIALLIIGGLILFKLKKPKPTARDILDKRSNKSSKSIESKGDLSRV